MILSQAVQFATGHDRFVMFLNERDINLNSVNQLTAKVTNVQNDVVEHRIYFDFGDRGESNNDVRVIIDFDKNTRAFSFIQIDYLGR